MNKEKFNEAYMEIDDFRDKLGETFFDFFNEEDNSTYEIAKSIIAVIDTCETERDFEIADRMVTAICGYCLESIIDKIKRRDAVGHCWESIY